jgi:plastocyanin
MDELTARLQRAAAEVAERAVVPVSDDIVRRGRRQRRRHTIGAALLAIALAGGVVVAAPLRLGQPAPPPGTRPATPSPSILAPGQGSPTPATAARLTATAVAFDTACLTAVAGEPFTLTFHNQDVGVPHNVAIFEGSNANGPNVFRGQIVVGPATVAYHVPALRPGLYFFNCDVHPNSMHGQLIVR